MCVLLAHLVGLLSVSRQWPTHVQGSPDTRIRFQTAAPNQPTALSDANDHQPPGIAQAKPVPSSRTAVNAPKSNAPTMRLASEDTPVASLPPDDQPKETAQEPPSVSPPPTTASNATTEPLPAPASVAAPAKTEQTSSLPEPATANPPAGPAVPVAPAINPVETNAVNRPALPAMPTAPEQNGLVDKPTTTNPTPATASSTANDAPAWLNSAHFNWPASTRFIYEVIGESKGLRFNADGDMLWKHDGAQYEMRLEIKHFLLGSKTQTSVGQLGPQGLLPKRFGDKYKQEVAAHFDRDKGQLIFSASSNPQPLLPGAQDRLSLFAQLGALLAGSPELRQSGQQISFQVVAAKSADIWTFQVEKQEALQLPAGKFNAWKLSRVFKGTYDQTADVWLSPTHGYLPIKVRIAQTNGDVMEQNLSKVQAP